MKLGITSIGRLWISHGHVSSTTYCLSCGAGVITATNLRIIRGGEKRQKDTGTVVDLSVNYEDYIACKGILAKYNA